jgi:hypothetical protein
MLQSELAQLELLAEVDALVDAMTEWSQSAPPWDPARTCRALVRRLGQRAETIRTRLGVPLVVATMGGSGTGKSALVNAILGDNIVPTGRVRPTTRRPILICRPDLSPPMLGIPPEIVELIPCSLAPLADLVLIDCPDPDTSEGLEPASSSLARLRQILPLCDVLLVTATQQKYRSARVADELADAAAGAHLVFVQTHADVDPDIRDDWRQVLGDRYAGGHIFVVDSLAALADAQAGREPQGEFAGLTDLLTRRLAGTAAGRIRRANLLDLTDQALVLCRQRLDQALPAVERLRSAIHSQRGVLAAHLAGQMREGLLRSRRQWESRLVAQIVSRWGFSPFALLLRVYQGLGGLLSGALLLRARTPAQVALWGAVEAGRVFHRRRADAAAGQFAAQCWEPADLRAAALVLEGYAAEAGLPRQSAAAETVTAEAAEAARAFAAQAAAQLESLLGRLADRHSGWFTRGRYELLLLAALGLLLFRLGKNFFYDSWIGPHPVAAHGVDFYLVAAFWMGLWCLALLWAFTSRLRRGLRRHVGGLAEDLSDEQSAAGAFALLESDCRRAAQFRQDLEQLQRHVSALQARLTLPDELLSRRKAGRE